MRKDRYRPSDISDEEWEELKSEMSERDVDNSNHYTTQLKIKKILKLATPVVILVLGLLGYYVFTQYQELVYSVLGTIVVVVVLYFYFIDDFTPDSQ